MVFQQMRVARDANQLFDSGEGLCFSMIIPTLKLEVFPLGQYLLANPAYALLLNCIPAYKAPASNIPINTEFNYCIAKARVRNEHTIGIMKGRWALLQELRLSLQTKRDMQQIIQWVNACVTLHNMLAQLGNAWDEMETNTGLNGPQHHTKVATACGAEDHWAQAQARCIEINYANGILLSQFLK